METKSTETDNSQTRKHNTTKAHLKIFTIFFLYTYNEVLSFVIHTLIDISLSTKL